MSVSVIAEAGVNHNGNIDLAYKLIDAAVDAKADAVKFQTFVANYLVGSTAPKAKYQTKTTDPLESQLSMLKRLELTENDFLQLQKYCKTKGIDFLSTAFETQSLSFLYGNLGLKVLKIPSGELSNAPFILEHARTGCDLIISTGMADVDDIKRALSVVAYGYVTKQDLKAPSLEDFEKAYSSKEGQQLLIEKVTLLHCTTEYPAALEDINLSAMNSMHRLFGLPVGYSDHSQGIVVPIAAAALGAKIIEKHFTLDCSMEGPDHRASLEPHDLKLMVDAIRSVGLLLGSGEKKITSSELNNKKSIHKSLIATQDIAEGDFYTKLNVGIMRPGTGRSPFLYWDTIGTIAQKAVKIGCPIE